MMRRIGRFRVPAGAPAAADYFLRELFVPRSRRERWLARAAAWLPSALGLALLADAAARPGAGESEEGVDEIAALRGAAAARAGCAPSAVAAIVLAGLDAEARRLYVLFVGAEREPRWVAKTAWAPAARAALAREHERLLTLRARLSPALAATLPEPITLGAAEPGGALVLAAVRGHPVLAELARAPGDAALYRRHLEAAARWLGRFHRETAVRAGPVAALPESLRRARLRGDGIAPVDALEHAVRAGALPASDEHGDYWPRNVLLDGTAKGVSGVVDWEAPAGIELPHHDLFDFALCYAVATTPGGVRAASAVFRRAFLGRGSLAAAMRSYLETYAAESGLEPRWLEPLFRLYLTELAAGERELGLFPRGERDEVARTWMRQFTSADRSVFP